MARIRTIKPEFWSSPDTARASLLARLLYIAMWNWADDYGVGTANPKELVGFAFPNDDHPTTSELPSLCKEVADTFGTVFYIVRGRPFYMIPTWDSHQKTERRAKGKHPRPDDPDAAPDLRIYGSLGTSSDTQGNTLSTQGKNIAGTGEQGNIGTGEVILPSPPAKREIEPERADVEGLCRQLADRIAANGVKRPTITATWRKAARLLIDNDGYTPAEIREVLDWCQTDSFWAGNIQSLPTFRKQFGQLKLKAKPPRDPDPYRKQRMLG